MNRYHTLPTALLQNIDKTVHELCLAEVMAEMKSKREVYFKRLLDEFTDTWNAFSNERRVRLVQICGSKIGQYVILLGDDDQSINDHGYGTLWSSYTPNGRLDKWRNNPNSLKQFHHYTDEDWSKHYSTKISRSGLDDNRQIVRLMIGSIPKIPAFAKFQKLEDEEFMMQYPGFIPVEILLDYGFGMLSQRDITLTDEQRQYRNNQRAAQQAAE